MIKILVDSASDIDLKEANARGINLIAMEINFGEEQYFDGIDLNHKDFFNKLIETNVIPKTSQINEYRFKEKFDQLTDDGSQVLCITMSSKLSGTYNNAKSIAKNYNGNVEVVDSLNVTIGERILIEYALQLIAKDWTLSDIVKQLNEKKTKIKLVALLNTLKYLQKGGRISKFVAFAGELINIKPVISIVDGEVKLTGKALGSKKGNNMLVQQIEKSGGIDFSMPFATAYSGLNDTLLQKYLEDSESLWKDKTDKVPVYMIGSTIGTHAGPGAVAVAFFGKK